MLRRIIPVLLIWAAFLMLLGFGGGPQAMAARAGRTPVYHAAMTAKQAPAGGGDAMRGREVFSGTCSLCHGASGRGMQGFGKDLVKQSEWMKKQDDAALIAFIKRGRPADDPLNESGYEMMPLGGNPTLTNQDVTDVVAYIRQLQSKK